MYGALTGEKHELPFSLNIQGSKWGNLLRVPSQNAVGNESEPPYVLPDSIELTTSIDDRGGELSFELVSRGSTVVENPWWSTSLGYNASSAEPYLGRYHTQTLIPDNAVVEFRVSASASPTGEPGGRLFLGFIESMESSLQPGGRGTVTRVHCVSTTALLDRIVVRKAIPKNRRGQAAGRFTVRAGSDRFQIQQILRHAGAKRTSVDLMLFNPRDFREISKTVASLPKLEVPIGTLREALEAVLEAAQAKDGIRRNIHINPETGALHYSQMVDSFPGNSSYTSGALGDESGYDLGYGSAPFAIVDDPAAVQLACSTTKNDWQLLQSLAPDLAYGLGSPDPSVREAKQPANRKYRAHFYNRGRATGGHIYKDGVRDTFPTNATPVGVPGGPVVEMDDARAKHPLFAHEGDRTLSLMIGGGTKIRIGGTNGVIIESDYTGSPRALTLTFDGVVYDLSGRTEQPGSDIDIIQFRYDAAAEETHVVVNGEALVENAAQTLPTTALDGTLRVWSYDILYGNTGVRAQLGLLGWWTRALSDAELALLWRGNFPNRLHGSIMPRELSVSVDHSRVVKTAVFLAADSRADRDKDPDPYVRRYDQPGVIPAQADLPLVGLASLTPSYRRPGVRFEAIVDAATVRSGTPTQRSQKISRLARGYFRAQAAPRIGGRFAIRGAGTEPGQELGFAGGWPTHLAEQAGQMYSPTGEETRRFHLGQYRTWRPGQIVSISTALISGNYTIKSVTMSFEPGGFIRRFDIEFGDALPRSVAQLVAIE